METTTETDRTAGAAANTVENAVAAAAAEEEKIPVQSKLWLNLADCFSTTMNSLLTGGGLTYIFVTYMHLDAKLSALVWIIFGIWNALNDPLFGFISDRTKSKLGRRIPYIRYGAFFYGAIFALSWQVYPFTGSQMGMFFQMLTSLFLFDTLYTAIATSIYVMPYEMAISNKARSSLFIWRACFSVVSIAAPLVLMPMLKPQVGADATVFRTVMALIGAAAAAVIFTSTFFYKENNYVRQEQPSMLTSIVQCFKNKAFLVFEVLSFSVIFIQTILMTGVIYYFDAFSQCPMALCYGLMLAGVIAGMVLWSTQLKKREVRDMTFFMCAVFGAGCVTMIFLGSFPAAAAAGFFCVGVGFSGGMYLVPMMNGDIIDYDESVTGRRSEGMYAGINSLITKPAISLANAAFPLILGWFGYNTQLKIAAQAAWAKQGILVAWMAIPAIMLVLCCVSMKFYPLHGAEWANKKAALEERHSQR
jgi:GPH family glycoside/pentoside/hexuronide:cation symporter